MIMIGGSSTNDCNDCWIFNIKTKLWKKVKPLFIDYVYGIINVITNIYTQNLQAHKYLQVLDIFFFIAHFATISN